MQINKHVILIAVAALLSAPALLTITAQARDVDGVSVSNHISNSQLAPGGEYHAQFEFDLKQQGIHHHGDSKTTEGPASSETKTTKTNKPKSSKAKRLAKLKLKRARQTAKKRLEKREAKKREYQRLKKEIIIWAVSFIIMAIIVDQIFHLPARKPKK